MDYNVNDGSGHTLLSHAIIRVHENDLRQLKQENRHLWNCLIDILNANAYSLLRRVIGIYNQCGVCVPDIDTLCFQVEKSHTTHVRAAPWMSVSDYFLTQILYSIEPPPAIPFGEREDGTAAANRTRCSDDVVVYLPMWLRGSVTSISTFVYVLSIVAHQILTNKTTATTPLQSLSILRSNNNTLPTWPASLSHSMMLGQFIYQWTQLLQFTFPSLILLLCEQRRQLVPLITTSLNGSHVCQQFISQTECIIKDCGGGSGCGDNDSTEPSSSSPFESSVTSSSRDPSFSSKWLPPICNQLTNNDDLMAAIHTYLSRLTDFVYPVHWIVDTFRSMGLVKLALMLNEWLQQHYLTEHQKSVDLRQSDYHHPTYSSLLQPTTQQYFQALILSAPSLTNSCYDSCSTLPVATASPLSVQPPSSTSLLSQVNNVNTSTTTNNMMMSPQENTPKSHDDSQNGYCQSNSTDDAQPQYQKSSSTTSDGDVIVFDSADHIIHTLSLWRSQYHELGRKINILTRHLLSSLQQQQTHVTIPRHGSDGTFSSLSVPLKCQHSSSSSLLSNRDVAVTNNSSGGDQTHNADDIGTGRNVMVSKEKEEKTCKDGGNRGNTTNIVDDVMTDIRQVLECPICMDRLVVGCLTPCGHLYCVECGHQVIQQFRRCSQCQQMATQFVRIYFPGNNADQYIDTVS